MKFFLIVTVSVCLYIIQGCKESEQQDSISIETVLKDQPRFSNIKISVNEGVATLSGWVEDGASQDAAIAKLKTVAGVDEVVSRLSIGTNPVIQEKYADKVRTVLKAYPGVNGIISDSVIVLNGTLEKAVLPALVQQLQSLEPKNVVTKNIVLH